MALDVNQQRAALAMCCAVARADGLVAPREVEALLDILSRFARDVVSYSELQRWLDEGPPALTTDLREDELRGVVRDALAVAHADGTIDDSELATIKHYAERYLNRAVAP